MVAKWEYHDSIQHVVHQGINNGIGAYVFPFPGGKSCADRVSWQRNVFEDTLDVLVLEGPPRIGAASGLSTPQLKRWQRLNSRFTENINQSQAPGCVLGQLPRFFFFSRFPPRTWRDFCHSLRCVNPMAQAMQHQAPGLAQAKVLRWLDIGFVYPFLFSAPQWRCPFWENAAWKGIKHEHDNWGSHNWCLSFLRKWGCGVIFGVWKGIVVVLGQKPSFNGFRSPSMLPWLRPCAFRKPTCRGLGAQVSCCVLPFLAVVAAQIGFGGSERRAIRRGSGRVAVGDTTWSYFGGLFRQQLSKKCICFPASRGLGVLAWNRWFAECSGWAWIPQSSVERSWLAKEKWACLFFWGTPSWWIWRSTKRTPSDSMRRGGGNLHIVYQAKMGNAFIRSQQTQAIGFWSLHITSWFAPGLILAIISFLR